MLQRLLQQVTTPTSPCEEVGNSIFIAPRALRQPPRHGQKTRTVNYGANGAVEHIMRSKRDYNITHHEDTTSMSKVYSSTHTQGLCIPLFWRRSREAGGSLSTCPRAVYADNNARQYSRDVRHDTHEDRNPTASRGGAGRECQVATIPGVFEGVGCIEPVLPRVQTAVGGLIRDRANRGWRYRGLLV